MQFPSIYRTILRQPLERRGPALCLAARLSSLHLVIRGTRLQRAAFGPSRVDRCERVGRAALCPLSGGSTSAFVWDLLRCMKTQTPVRFDLWLPPTDLSPAEEVICKRMKKTGKLYAFLRRKRDVLFDEPFQRELLAMYSQESVGAPPVAPAMLAMVTLLQAYERCSDADAVEQTVFDKRWQMVLNLPDNGEAGFAQGVLPAFRARLAQYGMDKRLLERSVEVARQTGEFSHKSLRVALDSSPLWGAGRVEDTFNLIGHALAVVVACVAAAHDCKPAEIVAEAKLELVGGSSTKAALDIDWNDDTAQHEALQRLLGEVAKAQAWVETYPARPEKNGPIQAALATLHQVASQDLEAKPRADGTRGIADGTVKDRRISIEDRDMRHGRKSSSQLIDGYKRYVAVDIDADLIIAAAVLPANQAEAGGADIMRPDIEKQGVVSELHIDRGFLASVWVAEHDAAGGEVFCKPWTANNGDKLPKSAFQVDTNNQQVTCPAGQVATYTGKTAQFPAAVCATCTRKPSCTGSKAGRSVSIHRQEPLMQKLQLAVATPAGRKALRPRTAVEHRQAHNCRLQGPQARYIGTRKNDLDLRRCAAVCNLLQSA